MQNCPAVPQFTRKTKTCIYTFCNISGIKDQLLKLCYSSCWVLILTSSRGRAPPNSAFLLQPHKSKSAIKITREYKIMSRKFPHGSWLIIVSMNYNIKYVETKTQGYGKSWVQQHKILNLKEMLNTIFYSWILLPNGNKLFY